MFRYDDEDDEDEDKGSNEGSGESAILSRLLKARTIVVAEPVTDKLYRRVAQAITMLEQADSEAPITVYVNSPGGSADSGFAIYDLLRFTPCPVRSIANGIVASSAVLIYLAGTERFSLPSARFLLHQPSTSARGQASDIDITAREIVKIRKAYNEVVKEHTGKPFDQIEKDADRDFWLNAVEAQEYGLVQKVVSKKSEL